MHEDRTCVGILTCTGDDCPCTWGLQLTSRSEGRRTVSCHIVVFLRLIFVTPCINLFDKGFEQFTFDGTDAKIT